MSVWMRRLAGYAAASVILLVGWQLLSMAVGSQALPGPVPALADFFRLFISDLLPHAGISAWRVVASMTIGAATATPLGLAIGRSPRVDAVA
ncbi:MAG: ABC transporter permease, partial [Actinomycetia bacterium]|nr:ABC transporter permease [Actinomycetes bacterium]